jgi:hypothetical protein
LTVAQKKGIFIIVKERVALFICLRRANAAKEFLEMKKLLLVMLTLALVLGVISCGNSPTDGNQNPIALQGRIWTGTGGLTPLLIFTGNQVTLKYGTGADVITAPYRTEYDGPENNNLGPDGDELVGRILTKADIAAARDVKFAITFFDFDSPYTELGTLTCLMTVGGADKAFDVVSFEPSDEARYYADPLIAIFKGVTAFGTL